LSLALHPTAARHYDKGLSERMSMQFGLLCTALKGRPSPSR